MAKKKEIEILENEAPQQEEFKDPMEQERIKHQELVNDKNSIVKYYKWEYKLKKDSSFTPYLVDVSDFVAVDTFIVNTFKADYYSRVVFKANTSSSKIQEWEKQYVEAELQEISKDKFLEALKHSQIGRAHV